MVPACPDTPVLIPCTGNPCRSQMAEGWIDHLTSFPDPADEIRARLVPRVPAHR